MGSGTGGGNRKEDISLMRFISYCQGNWRNGHYRSLPLRRCCPCCRCCRRSHRCRCCHRSIDLTQVSMNNFLLPVIPIEIFFSLFHFNWTQVSQSVLLLPLLDPFTKEEFKFVAATQPNPTQPNPGPIGHFKIRISGFHFSY